MGCGQEIAPNTNRTPGWKCTNIDKIEKDPRGFNRMNLKRNHNKFYKLHYTVYKLGVQIVTLLFYYTNQIQNFQMLKKLPVQQIML
jgi:hypothetical protein